MNLADLRKTYHENICSKIIRISGKDDLYPNFADTSSKASKEFAWSIVNQLGCLEIKSGLRGQTAGGLFEKITKDFIEDSFSLLSHVRPGRWLYTTKASISRFAQYQHLADIDKYIAQYPELSTTFGQDYIITPDIVVGRYPLEENEINQNGEVLAQEDNLAEFTFLRSKNLPQDSMILHASISCKWTIRSDRTQNTRTEALNLIRNRKGNLPHVVAVTAEPLPTRIAALALGTGDLDFVYHFALFELIKAVENSGNEDQRDMLDTLVQGNRLRDISDLPFDLAI